MDKEADLKKKKHKQQQQRRKKQTKTHKQTNQHPSSKVIFLTNGYQIILVKHNLCLP